MSIRYIFECSIISRHTVRLTLFFASLAVVRVELRVRSLEHMRGVKQAKYVGWTDMASAEREPITGVWRRSDPPTPPVKFVGFVSISGATSSKSGVDMSTAVHPTGSKKRPHARPTVSDRPLQPGSTIAKVYHSEG